MSAQTPNQNERARNEGASGVGGAGSAGSAGSVDSAGVDRGMSDFAFARSLFPLGIVGEAIELKLENIPSHNVFVVDSEGNIINKIVVADDQTNPLFRVEPPTGGLFIDESEETKATTLDIGDKVALEAKVLEDGRIVKVLKRDVKGKIQFIARKADKIVADFARANNSSGSDSDRSGGDN